MLENSFLLVLDAYEFVYRTLFAVLSPVEGRTLALVVDVLVAALADECSFGQLLGVVKSARKLLLANGAVLQDVSAHLAAPGNMLHDTVQRL